jgi:TolB-like protein/Flp pilus assembly protein TadD
MRLISELKRRNVLRMAVMYVVAAWLVMQVAGVLMDLGVLPQEVGPWVMAVLAIGCPIALVVSWFFDITPEGVVRDADVSEDQPVLAAGGRRTDFVIIAMLAAAVILLLVWEPPTSGEDALTVLPFESMTGPDEAAFSEGLSIELKSLMAQLRRFKVKNPPAADILVRLSDVRTLSKEMNVRWVLKGSVRRAENRVRIAVELIDADDDASIAWSNVFDRELSAKNLFAIQTEIARSITSELRRTLDEPAEKRLAAAPTENTEAYAAYLIGRRRLADRKVAGLKDAVEQFALAVELDPQFASAYAGLMDACGLYESYSGGHSNDNCPPSPAGREQLARKAIELDPESGEAWISLGGALHFGQPAEGEDRLSRLKKAEEAYIRGLELSPNASQGYLWYGLNLKAQAMTGSADDYWAAWKDEVWQSVLRRGLEVDPLSIPLHYQAAQYPEYSRTADDALWHVRRIVEIAPDSPRGYERLAEYSWSLEGRADEAIRWAHAAMRVDPDQSWFPELTAYAYTALGDFDMALAYALKAERMLPEERQASAEAVYQRGWIYLHSGRINEAIEIFERLQGRVPDWGMNYSLNALASLDLAAGDYDRALSRAESHRERCLEQKEVVSDWWNCPILEFARILEAAGDSATAVKFLDAFSEDASPDASAAQMDLEGVEELFLVGNLGKAFVNSGDIAARGAQEKALDRIEKAVHLGWRGYAFPQNDWRFAAFYDIRLDHIRDHPRFQAAIAVIEADMAQQLENVHAMQRAGEIPTLEDLQAELQSAEQERGNAGN